MKLPGHPSHHGWHVNMDLCGVGLHRICDGFSGGHDTYLCGCCCHDPDSDLTAAERAMVDRVRGLEWFLRDAPRGLVRAGEVIREAQRVPGYPAAPRVDGQWLMPNPLDGKQRSRQ